MKEKFLLWFGTVVVAALSLAAAFFVVFNSVFSDVFGWRGRIEAFAYVAVAYALLAFFTGLAGPKRVRLWTWVYVAPAAAILTLYTFSEPQNALIHLATGAIAASAVWAGGWAALKMRKMLVKK